MLAKTQPTGKLGTAGITNSDEDYTKYDIWRSKISVRLRSVKILTYPNILYFAY